MSSQLFSDVRRIAATSLSMSDPSGLPLAEVDQGLRQSPAGLFLGETHGDEGRPTLVTAETEQSAANREVAYRDFIKTSERTPEYYQALEAFISLLFPDCTPPTTTPTEP
jgi:hypothetical protein